MSEKKLLNEEELEKVAGGGLPQETTHGLAYCICKECGFEWYSADPANSCCYKCGKNNKVCFSY